MNLDVYAAWTHWRRTEDTLETQCRRTEALSAQNLGAETAKEHTITK